MSGIAASLRIIANQHKNIVHKVPENLPAQFEGLDSSEQQPCFPSSKFEFGMQPEEHKQA